MVCTGWHCGQIGMASTGRVAVKEERYSIETIDIGFFYCISYANVVMLFEKKSSSYFFQKLDRLRVL